MRDSSRAPGRRPHRVGGRVGALPLAPRELLRRVLRVLGPGLITGAADADPTSVGTFAKAGATLGFSVLWAPLAIFPLMAAVQYISGKVGVVTGHGLAGVMRRHYSRAVLYP